MHLVIFERMCLHKYVAFRYWTQNKTIINHSWMSIIHIQWPNINPDYDKQYWYIDNILRYTEVIFRFHLFWMNSIQLLHHRIFWILDNDKNHNQNSFSYNKYDNRYTWSISSRFKVVYVSNPKCFHPSKKSSHQEQWWSNFCRVHLGKKGKPHKKSFLCFLNVKLANRKVFSFGLYIIQNISCRNF